MDTVVIMVIVCLANLYAFCNTQDGYVSGVADGRPVLLRPGDAQPQQPYGPPPPPVGGQPRNALPPTAGTPQTDMRLQYPPSQVIGGTFLPGPMNGQG
jgi:hypothetical protein